VATYAEMSEALYKGDVDQTRTLVQQAVRDGMPAGEILGQGLLKGMDRIGEDFKNGVVFVPEVIFASRAMEAAMEVLQPVLAKAGIEPIGRVLIGTVAGDMHSIGKQLVAIMLRGAGFLVEDLGVHVPVEKFVEAARKSGACIVAMSTLLTTTMPVMGQVIGELRRQALKDVRTMIGGAPVTQDFAAEIGADGYAPDAAVAVDLARKLLGVAR
jgi:5-methyltetrahydrofolate--homocysteine methyltransferase